MANSLRAYRQNQVQNPNAFDDPGLLQVITAVQSLQGVDCPDPELVTLVGSLLAGFGAVQSSTGTSRYVWVECPPPIGMKRLCLDTTEFKLDDGGSAPIVVELEVQTEYPY